MICICLHVVCSSGLGRPAASLALSHCSSDIALVCFDLAHDVTLELKLTLCRVNLASVLVQTS